MIRCQFCGAAAYDNSKFCTNCGRPLQGTAAKEEILMSRCPKCGYEPTKPSKFCIHCGASLVASPPPQAAAQDQPAQQQSPEQAAAQGQPAQQQSPEQAAAQNQPAQQYVQYNAQAQYYAAQPAYYQPGGALQTLCSRLKVSAILLLITGIMQAISGIILMIFGIYTLVFLGQYASYYGYLYSGSYSHSADLVLAIVLSSVLLGLGLLMLVTCIFNLMCTGRTFSYCKEIQQSPVGIVAHFQHGGKTIALLVLNILTGGVIGIVGSAFALAARSHVLNNANQFAELERETQKCYR